jgi:mannose-6-phosphate isomerase-like protein (cupin superfamily)
MAFRRVVTGQVDGRSSIIEDGEALESPYWHELWVTDPAEPMGHAPTEAEVTLEPTIGSSRWRVFLVPPDAVLRELIAEHLGADSVSDDTFFHQTNTLDLIYVLEGDVTLRVEDGETLLHPGDCVVQRGANHAWRNDNDTPVQLLGVMTTVADDADA